MIPKRGILGLLCEDFMFSLGISVVLPQSAQCLIQYINLCIDKNNYGASYDLSNPRGYETGTLKSESLVQKCSLDTY